MNEDGKHNGGLIKRRERERGWCGCNSGQTDNYKTMLLYQILYTFNTMY